MRIFFTLLIITSFHLKSIAQKSVFSIALDPDLKYENSHIERIEDENTILISIFFKNKIQTLLLDSDFQKISEFTAEKPKISNMFYAGFTKINDTYAFVFRNERGNKYSYLSIDFAGEHITYADLQFKKEESEVILKSFNQKNNLFVLSAGMNSKSFNLYKLEGEKFEKNVFKINDTVEKSTFFKGSALELLDDTAILGSESNLEIINTKNSTDIRLASTHRKLFLDNNSIKICIDKEKDATRIFSINPETMAIKRDVVYHTRNPNVRIRKSNSFLYDNKLLQIALTKDLLKFTVTDLGNKKIVKEYYADNKNGINFKNGPIYFEKEGAYFDKDKKIEESKEFFKKINKGEIAISIVENKGIYMATIGSFKTSTYNNTPIGMTPNGFGNAIPFNIGYLIGDTATKSTYFQSLFNKDFDHIVGKIDDFISKRFLNTINLTNRNLMFSSNGKTYKGVYVKALNKYKIKILEGY